MKLTATGGTDAGNIILFWPALLPPNADSQLKAEPIQLIEQLSAEGRLVRFPCDSDGGYSLGVFIDEPPSPDLEPVCQEEARIHRLHVSGDGYFGGAEYAFKHDRHFLDKHPHMASRLVLPPGQYEAVVYTTQLPDEFEDEWLRRHVSPAIRRRARAAGWLAAGASAAVLATIVAALARAPGVAWPLTAIALALILPAVLAANGRSVRAVSHARRSFEQAYPTYVLHLTTRTVSDIDDSTPQV